MRLFDVFAPALLDGDYHLNVRTAIGRRDLPLDDHVPPPYRFTLAGPRFQLSATGVAAVHPPRNAQSSAFNDLLPHIALSRRTLPWERAVDDPAHRIAEPASDPDDPEPRPLNDPSTPWFQSAPWLALLLFIDDPALSEVTLLSQVPLSTVVDADTLARLAGPQGSVATLGTEPVDAVEADGALLRQIVPSKDELRLLCHVRQVNVDDRELGAGSSDGWFSVVMANRLPTPGYRHRVCLVSVEQRADLILPDPPRPGDGVPALPARVRIVLLYSWTFTVPALDVPGLGSFRELTEHLTSALFAGDGTANAIQTGHIPLPLHDRVGSEQTTLYRGPLTPHAVPRDGLGPYHSADQARRVVADTGAEDISYAAAFEVGRLMAAADGRLAQELMRWRREDYHAAARTSVADAVYTTLPGILGGTQQGLATGMAAPVNVTALERASAGAGTPADTTGIQTARAAPGLDSARLSRAWSIPAAQAATLLGAKAPVPAPAASASGSGQDDPNAALRQQRQTLLGRSPTQEGQP
jgi:hypothetical protein